MLAPLEGSLALDDLDGPPKGFTERELEGTQGVDATLAPLEGSLAMDDIDEPPWDFTEREPALGVDATLAPLERSLALEDLDEPPKDFNDRELDGAFVFSSKKSVSSALIFDE
eukprot:scaffold17668_cov116-Skeletonema_marinoi.AAC.1